jgi:UDP-GlcNAc:undecaprenyl-phosphate GlcNAc-1-phosphate transferase
VTVAVERLLLVGAMAFALSLLLTPLARGFARRFDLVDRPGGYKAHGAATPLLGGLAVAIAFIAVAAWSTMTHAPGNMADIAAIAIGAAIIVAVGLVDDVRGMSAGNKLLWQGLAAGVAGLTLGLLGVRVDLFLNWEPLPLALLTALWVVGVTNAMNMLDNMNGLCAGLGAIAAACLAIFNLRTGEAAVALAAIALSGACLGFLPWNWPRGKVFLGDTGSMLIGFALATLSVMGVYTRGAELPILAVLAPLFVLAIPLFDAAVVIVLRLRSGCAPWAPDRRHVSHRLVARGMRPTAAVATIWAAALGCGVAALLLPTTGATEAPLLLVLVGSLLVAVFAAAGSRGLS